MWMLAQTQVVHTDRVVCSARVSQMQDCARGSTSNHRAWKTGQTKAENWLKHSRESFCLTGLFLCVNWTCAFIGSHRKAPGCDGEVLAQQPFKPQGEWLQGSLTCDDTATVSIFASSFSQLSAELRFRNCMSKTQKKVWMCFKSKTKKEEEVEERIQWFETAQSLYLIENSTKHNISLGSFWVYCKEHVSLGDVQRAWAAGLSERSWCNTCSLGWHNYGLPWKQKSSSGMQHVYNIQH